MLQLPSPELQILIHSALNEDINRRFDDLEAIKQWLKKQPHLPDNWDDTMLMSFLRSCNFSLEKTKRRLDRYCTVKTVIPEFFTDYDIARPELQQVLKLIQIGTLSQLTPKGERVHVARSVTTNVDDIDFAVAAKIVYMFGHLRVKFEELGCVGDVLVLDAKNVTFRNILRISPALAKKFFVCALDAFPVKIKAVHVVNAMPGVDRVLMMVKPFLKDKIFRGVHVHEDLVTLQEHVSKDILPEELGGTAGTFKSCMDMYVKACEDFRPWLRKQEAVKADLAKRAREVLRFEEAFGLPGSFRKLVID